MDATELRLVLEGLIDVLQEPLAINAGLAASIRAALGDVLTELHSAEAPNQEPHEPT